MAKVRVDRPRLFRIHPLGILSSICKFEVMGADVGACVARRHPGTAALQSSLSSGDLPGMLSSFISIMPMSEYMNAFFYFAVRLCLLRAAGLLDEVG